jgi:Predicted integral membrane protein (DUF2269)
MDWGSLFKFCHVCSVIIWLGSGFVLVALGWKAERSRDNAEFGRIVDQVVYLSPRLFVPAAVCALLFGALTVYFEGWDMTSSSNLWIWIGLLGFAATFVTGNFVLRPRSEAVMKVVGAEGYSDRAVAMGSDLLAIAKFDFTMLFVVVADMVMKPSLNNWVTIAVFAIVLVAAAALFLAPAMRKGSAAMARATTR